MSFNNQENKESLGASHVPGGCNNKTGDLSQSDWASPRNGQDYSELTKGKGFRGICSLAALVPLFHAPLPHQTLSTQVLIGAGAVCLLFSLTAVMQKCKQVCINTENRQAYKRGVCMASVLEKELIKALEVDENKVVNNHIDSVRKNLEILVNQNSIDAAIREEFNRVLRSLNELDQVRKNGKVQPVLNKVQESDDIIGNLIDKYRDEIAVDILDGLRASIAELRDAIDWCQKFTHRFRGVKSALTEVSDVLLISKNSKKKDLQKWLKSLQIVARNMILIEEGSKEFDVPLASVFEALEKVAEKVISATQDEISHKGKKTRLEELESIRSSLFVAAKFLISEIEKRRKIKLEGKSAEAKAIQRLESSGESDEYITVIERGEPINIDEINAYLTTCGYDIQISCDGSSAD